MWFLPFVVLRMLLTNLPVNFDSAPIIDCAISLAFDLSHLIL